MLTPDQKEAIAVALHETFGTLFDATDVALVLTRIEAALRPNPYAPPMVADHLAAQPDVAVALAADVVDHTTRVLDSTERLEERIKDLAAEAFDLRVLVQAQKDHIAAAELVSNDLRARVATMGAADDAAFERYKALERRCRDIKHEAFVEVKSWAKAAIDEKDARIAELEAQIVEVIERAQPLFDNATAIVEKYEALEKVGHQRQCLYCGEIANDGGPLTPRDELLEKFKAHAAVCSGHPMRDLEKQVAALRSALVAAVGTIDDITDGMPGPHRRAPEAQQADWKVPLRRAADASHAVLADTASVAERFVDRAEADAEHRAFCDAVHVEPLLEAVSTAGLSEAETEGPTGGGGIDHAAAIRAMGRKLANAVDVDSTAMKILLLGAMDHRARGKSPIDAANDVIERFKALKTKEAEKAEEQLT